MPQLNGLAERVNDSIGNILRIYKGHNSKFIIDLMHDYHNFIVHTELNNSFFEIIEKYSVLDPLKRNLDELVTSKKEMFYIRKRNNKE